MTSYNEKSLINMHEAQDFANRFAHEPECQMEIDLIPVEVVNGTYEFSSTDIKLQMINRCKLRLTLPKLKGEGSAAYKKYAQFFLINEIEVFIVNASTGTETIVNSLTGVDLLEKTLAAPSESYFKNCFGSRDNYCKIKTGQYNDDTIFKEREITIPLTGLLPDNFIIYDETKIIFRLKMNPITEIITYNQLFKEKTLEFIQNLAYKNVTLLFSNTNMLKNGVPITNDMTSFFLKRKKVIGKIESDVIPSATFKNSYGVSFSTMTDIFNSNFRFITVPENDTRHDKLIEKWVLTILKDLIVVTDLDMTNDENKKKMGFNSLSMFEEVNNNIIYFDNEKRKSCKVFIENVPEDYKVYFHRNILTFSRGYDKNNILNISTFFKMIKGLCFLEDDCKVKYFYNEIVHNITLEQISIPVDIWDNESNTETRDLRSVQSKRNDMYYNNPFILGLDFLSEDSGYKNVHLKTSSNLFSFPNKDLKHEKSYNIYTINEHDENSFANKSIFETNSVVGRKVSCVYSDIRNNFEKFITTVNWNTYYKTNPKSLYGKIPVVTVYELMKISYKDKNIYIEPVVKNTDTKDHVN